ncbi:MAG: nitroreductase family protein [Bacteroidales bacterium]|nr:nitroreductase family protein [Bacteroidales bacterium]
MRKYLFIAVAFLAVLSCGQENKDAATAVSFDDVLATRRSIRDFDASKEVTEAQVREILTAAQDAPSWTNSQPSRYYVAISPDKADAVRELIGERNKQSTKGAPVFIVSTFVKGLSGFSRGKIFNEIGDGWGAYDNGLGNAYLVLKARAMGFDTLIMGMRDSDALRALFGIPDGEEVMAVIALGHRASDPVKPTRKPLDEIAKFF